MLLPAERTESCRRNKDELIWYLELSRMPGGGFKTPWFPGTRQVGSAPLYHTGMMAMAYTAQLRNLRIAVQRSQSADVGKTSRFDGAQLRQFKDDCQKTAERRFL